ncbi:MAG: hypothetical protein WBL39_01975, partial [Terrimicrobiaceae bacterium]
VFDRGHMVRRLDPVWGIEDAARLANSDTHHSTFFGGSNDQITLSELEERSGLDFERLKDFDVLPAQPVPKSLLRGARLRLSLTGVREAVLWAP